MVKVAAMGDNVVDCYLARGEMFPGGNCLNLAVHAGRFGAPSAYIGAIGRDPAGDLIFRALQAEGVDVSHLRRLAGPTAYCLIGHQGSDRVFLSSDLGVSRFIPSAEDLEFLRGFSAVHIGQSSGLDAYLGAAAQRTRLSYDLSGRREREHRRAVAPHCYLASLSGADLAEAEVTSITAELLSAGAELVLVTRGQRGALLASASGTHAVAAAPVQAVDTLGAGDTFIARTLVGLLRGEDPDALLAAAAAAAAATCRHFGAVGYSADIRIGAEGTEAALRAKG